MSVSYKVENVQISAVRDRAMFNTFAGNKSYVIEGIGDELEVSYASNSFIVQLGTGEAVICGGSMISEGELDTITLNANETGYLVIRIDLSQTGTNQCRFYSTPTIVQENINGGSEYIYDLPLYQYQTSNEGVQNMNDIRNILSSLLGGASFTVENGYVYVIYEVNGETIKKKLGSLDPATLTATPSDVLSGKIFGGSGSDEAQTGTMANQGKKTQTLNTSTTSYTIPQGYHNGQGSVSITTQTKTATPTTSAQNITPDSDKVLSKVTVNAVSLSGNATAAQVLKNKTFYNTTLSKVTGTMTDYTVSSETVRKTFTPTTAEQSYTIGKGYYEGSNVVKCNAIPNNFTDKFKYVIGSGNYGDGNFDKYIDLGATNTTVKRVFAFARRYDQNYNPSMVVKYLNESTYIDDINNSKWKEIPSSSWNGSAVTYSARYVRIKVTGDTNIHCAGALTVCYK